jgi:hypothetical protein
LNRLNNQSLLEFPSHRKDTSPHNGRIGQM